MIKRILRTCKESAALLLEDIKNLRFVLLGIFLYWLLGRLVFHHFCPMVIVTGFPCPGCGMTRAACSLLLFRLDDVWQYNPAVYAWVVWGVWAAWRRYIRKEKHFRQTGFIIALFVITMTCYIWRMCTIFPAGEPPMRYAADNLLARIPIYRDLVQMLLRKF